MSILLKLDNDSEHPFTEVVGVLQRIEGEHADRRYLVLKRDGSEVTVVDKAIMASKVVSPR